MALYIVMFDRLDDIVGAGYHLLHYNEKYAFGITHKPNEKYILFQWVKDLTAVPGGYWVIARRW